MRSDKVNKCVELCDRNTVEACHIRLCRPWSNAVDSSQTESPHVKVETDSI